MRYWVEIKRGTVCIGFQPDNPEESRSLDDLLGYNASLSNQPVYKNRDWKHEEDPVQTAILMGHETQRMIVVQLKGEADISEKIPAFELILKELVEKYGHLDSEWDDEYPNTNRIDEIQNGINSLLRILQNGNWEDSRVERLILHKLEKISESHSARRYSASHIHLKNLIEHLKQEYD